MVNLTQPCMEVYLEFLNQKILNKFYSSKRKNQKQQKKAKDVVEHLILKFGWGHQMILCQALVPQLMDNPFMCKFTIVVDIYYSKPWIIPCQPSSWTIHSIMMYYDLNKHGCPNSIPFTLHIFCSTGI